ncbi:MAG TPA: GGDEF domain-containing protein [Gallionella sp.]
MMKTLQNILDQRNLSALFQPIMDLSRGTILGYEGLIRGPADSLLHSPINLFAVAKQQGLALETEMLSRQIVLESFAALDLPGKLFLNVSPEALTHPSFKNGQTLAYLEKIGLDPARVIIEITENQPTFDFQGMRNALLHYREMGFQIAIDDLGEGFSSLRLWSELRPEFVKVDMHFVQGVNTDPLKQQFLRSIQQIAESAGTQVIAEGIETSSELQVVCNLDIACGQGYFIARPSPTPPLTATPMVSAQINLAAHSYSASANMNVSHNITTEKLLRYIEPAHPETGMDKIQARFSSDASLRAIPVVRNGVPAGLIERQHYMASMAAGELVHRESGTWCNNEPLLVDKSTAIQELSLFLTESDSAHLIANFIITDQGRYIGLGDAQSLLREITRLQIESARYADPLTSLPGNVPVNTHIEELLHQGKSFAVCHADLDDLSAFNETYGYAKGDEAIQLTGRLLGLACDPRLDFIGHIGGDDFVMVMQSNDWEKRCQQVLASFTKTSAALTETGHRAIGGHLNASSQGDTAHHMQPTLSIGIIWVTPEMFPSRHEIAAAAVIAKERAKNKPGNSLFIKRQRLHSHKATRTQHELMEVKYG